MADFGYYGRVLRLGPGEVYEMSVGSADHVRVIEAQVRFGIAFNNGPEIPAGIGRWWDATTEPFQTVTVRNTTEVPTAIELAWGSGRQGNDAVQLSGFIQTSERPAVRVVPSRVAADPFESVPLVAENPDRKSVTLFNRSDYASVTVLLEPYAGDTSQIPPGLHLGPRERVEISASVPLHVSASQLDGTVEIDVWEESYA